MARLFSLKNATAVDDPEHGHIEAGADGAFDFPDDLSDRMHRFCSRGKREWETETEREQRLHDQESARRSDPKTLYEAVEKIANLTSQLAGLQLAQARAEVPAAADSPGETGDDAPNSAPRRSGGKAPAPDPA